MIADVELDVDMYVAIAVGTGLGASRAATRGIPQIANAISAVNPSRAMIHTGRILTLRKNGSGLGSEIISFAPVPGFDAVLVGSSPGLTPRAFRIIQKFRS